MKIYFTTVFALCPNIENEFCECSHWVFLFCNLQIDSVTLEKALEFLSLCMKLLKVPTESMELMFWVH